MTNEPRTVTREQIEAEIASEHCFTAAEGIVGHMAMHGDQPSYGDLKLDDGPLGFLTICVLVLKNGAKVVGLNYGAIDPTVHSAELGRESARDEAREKVRDYLGFRLRDQIAAEQGAAPVAKRYAREDIDGNSLKWATLPHHEDPFQDKVSYVVSMRDGRQVRGAIRLPDDGTAWPTSRVAAYCALDALRVANGEAP